jgi:hypothetical protein
MENFRVPSKLENPLILNDVASDIIYGLANYAGLKSIKIMDAQNSPYVKDKVQKGFIEGDAPPLSKGEKKEKFISKLNTIVYSNVIFDKGVILNEEGEQVDKWDDFRIDDVLLNVSQSKKIITTEIQGRDGTVKEYIGLDDFQVQITGRLNGTYNVNPKELTRQLKIILSAGQPLEITSWYLQNLGIDDIVVKDFNFGQTEGEYSTQYFTINAMSDKRFEAKIIS